MTDRLTKAQEKRLIETIKEILNAYDVEWDMPAKDDASFDLPEAIIYNALADELVRAYKRGFTGGRRWEDEARK